MGGHGTTAALKSGRAVAVAVALCVGLGCRSSAPVVPGDTVDGDAAVRSPADPSEQAWVGHIALPGARLYLGLKLRRADDGRWTGTLDVPAQLIVDATLQEVTVEGDDMAFVLHPNGASESMAAMFSLAVDDDEATGTLVQGGAVFPVTLHRLDETQTYAVGPNRPQQPTPPFPYDSVEVEFSSKDGTKLAGTLTIPRGEGPHPGVVLMTGSGPQDRDETWADHKPFWVLADHLTREGIAVLRYDDRGVQRSSGTYETSTVMDFVDDGLAALAALRDQEGIAKSKTGIIGHSQGAVEAAIAAVKSKDVAFVVMLAGFGLEGREVLVLQNKAILELQGIDAREVAAQLQAQNELLDAYERGATHEELQTLGVELVDRRVARTKRHETPPPSARGEAMLTKLIIYLETTWFRSVLDLDPRPWLRRLDRPAVLVVIGSKDTQVPADANMPAIAEALRRSKNEDVTLETMEGLNHLLQHADRGTPDEYAEIDETIAPEVLTLVTRWIRERTQ